MQVLSKLPKNKINTDSDQGYHPVDVRSVSDTVTNFTNYGQLLLDKEIQNLTAKNGENKNFVRSILKKEQTYKGSLIYGKRGLLNFMENLLVYLDENDKSKLNFYFTIRESIIEYIDLK
jgi:hypothetical protein